MVVTRQARKLLLPTAMKSYDPLMKYGRGEWSGKIRMKE